MGLERPDWFDRAAEWWHPAVGDDIARHVQPVSISSGGGLYVRCSSTAWTTHMRLLAPRLAERLNQATP
ncbi:DciA family protein [Streptomyces sp. NPDC059862]|uniref:DciA family protein n=1 Tax=Streptomyces sp. NPDC059862 TaxID=3346975 RepID=UPI0036574878